MADDIAAVWSRNHPPGVQEQLRTILDQAVRLNNRLQIFFRADDIARVDKGFRRLMRLFQDHRMPLCLAVVPEWLTGDNWRDMQQFDPQDPLWCWHQHGWNHTNHERQGKKSEFGPARNREDIRRDLANGKKHLSALLGDLFHPVFTPPWNRCSSATLELLEELDFLAVSRSLHAKPPYSGRLPDFAVNVDLHTRKETDWRQGWDRLLLELTEAVHSGCMGIMVHHRCMNDTAFEFLSLLLPLLREQQDFICGTFRELAR